MDNTLDVLLKQCRDKRIQVTDAVANGASSDYAEYRAMCGEIRGLLTAEMYINDLAKYMETSDE
jgi:hypothetical protein